MHSTEFEEVMQALRKATAHGYEEEIEGLLQDIAHVLNTYFRLVMWKSEVMTMLFVMHCQRMPYHGP
jgi:hypothetical protein